MAVSTAAHGASEEQIFSIDCAKKAGELIMKYFKKMPKLIWKGKTDFKTEVDDKCDLLLRNMIQTRFPKDTIYSEETPYKKGSSEREWYIDPLDGTFMFEADIGDQFGVAIALTQDNIPILGTIYFPKRDELYTAQIGKGASCNGTPITVAKPIPINKVKMGINHGKFERIKLIPYLDKLWSENGVTVCILLACATAPLCFTAAGKLNAYMAVGLEPWDMAAAVPIIREAGGKVTHFDGREWIIGKDSSILTAHPKLHKKIVDFLKH